VVIACAVTGFVAYAIYGQAAQGRQLDADAASIAQQNAALRQQISEHQREIVEAQTNAWLIEEARKLGYIFPGEKIFVIPSPGSAPSAGGGVNAPLPSYSALPPASPSPSAATPGPGQATPAPTPVQIVVPTPTPH
jgi:cell division protein FtsB